MSPDYVCDHRLNGMSAEPRDGVMVCPICHPHPRPNRRADFPPGTRVVRHGDNVPGTVVDQPPGERVVVWWDNGVRSAHHIKHLRAEVPR